MEHKGKLEKRASTVHCCDLLDAISDFRMQDKSKKFSAQNMVRPNTWNGKLMTYHELAKTLPQSKLSHNSRTRERWWWLRLQSVQFLKVRGFATVPKCCLTNSHPVALFLASQVCRFPSFLEFSFNDDQGSLILHRPSISYTPFTFRLPNSAYWCCSGLLIAWQAQTKRKK